MNFLNLNNPLWLDNKFCYTVTSSISDYHKTSHSFVYSRDTLLEGRGFPFLSFSGRALSSRQLKSHTHSVEQTFHCIVTFCFVSRPTSKFLCVCLFVLVLTLTENCVFKTNISGSLCAVTTWSHNNPMKQCHIIYTWC